MYIKLYFIALSVFLAIDALWLGFIAKDLYQDQIGFLMKNNVNWVAALIFYLLFILGLVVFVIFPAIEQGEWSRALILGALFGLITYGTYDLTNLATIEGWPIMVTIIDLVWGMFIASSVSTITYFIVTKLLI
ncbi:MAG: DUF2177 family protein [Patescibacteria group bacterium]